MKEILCQSCDRMVAYKQEDIRRMGKFPYVVCEECGAYVPLPCEELERMAISPQEA